MAVRLPTGLQAIGQQITGVPGYQPNYHALITANPGFAQTLANVTANNAAAKAQSDAALQSQSVGYGAIPDLSSAAAQLGLPANSPFLKALQAVYADPNIQSAATNNPYSTTKLAQHLNDVDLAKNRMSLAGRGDLQTSDLGVLDKITNDKYGETNQANLLSYLTGVQHAFNTYTGAVQTGQNQLTNAGTKAAGQVTASPLGQPVAGTGFLGSMPHAAFNGLNIPGARVAAPQAPPTGAMGSHGGPL